MSPTSSRIKCARHSQKGFDKRAADKMSKLKSVLETARSSPLTLIPLVALLTAPFLFRASRSPKRSSIIPPLQERVLILGASSGVGRVLASLYAARGARACLVARRESELKKAYAESVVAAATLGKKNEEMRRDIVMVVADASDARQMVDLRTRLEEGMCESALQ